MRAVLMAGGSGTRLRPLNPKTPKPRTNHYKSPANLKCKDGVSDRSLYRLF